MFLSLSVDRKCRRALWTWASLPTAPITQATKARTDTSTFWPVRCSFFLFFQTCLFPASCHQKVKPLNLSSPQTTTAEWSSPAVWTETESAAITSTPTLWTWVASYQQLGFFSFNFASNNPALPPPVSSAGLRANQSVHRGPRAPQVRQRGLLEDDLAAERRSYCHDHQPQGERTGRWSTPVKLQRSVNQFIWQ